MNENDLISAKKRRILKAIDDNIIKPLDLSSNDKINNAFEYLLDTQKEIDIKRWRNK